MWQQQDAFYGTAQCFSAEQSTMNSLKKKKAPHETLCDQLGN